MPPKQAPGLAPWAAFALGALIGLILGASVIFLVLSPQSGGNTCGKCLNGTVETVFSPGAEDEVLGLIRGANESIDVEMYLFNYRPLADELVKAEERGVKVRVILEPRLSGDNANLEMMKFLREKGISARWASLDYKLTHAKTMIVDRRRVLVGSTNWSMSALLKNREYSVLIEDSEVVGEFVKNFEQDWAIASQAEQGTEG
jgi:phosphatidylserine/phosphatidylglycerophosphate/cardiolipin synthase-like enzyme